MSTLEQVQRYLDPQQPCGIAIGMAMHLALWRKAVRRAHLAELSKLLTPKQYASVRQGIASFMLNRHPSKAGRGATLIGTGHRPALL